VLVIPLVLGIPRLYSYDDPRAVALDKALQHKIGWLNEPAVVGRLVIYFAVFGAISYLLTYWSRRQDETEDYKYLTHRSWLSGPGIILFSVAMSFAAVDWIMALEPDWYSTMFPGFYLVGQALTAFAVVIAVLHFVSERPPLSDIVSAKDFHDLGNLLLTFVILWAYVEVSQLIITWSGNLPKEIVWYLHRTQGNWAWITFVLVVFHFAVPFFILLGRSNKLQSQRLARVAIFIVAMHLLDNYWNVEPSFHSRIYVHWLDFAAPIGLGGIWVGLLLRQLKRYPLVPAHDPRVVEALEKAL
jgi:hypothetical protein